MTHFTDTFYIITNFKIRDGSWSRTRHLVNMQINVNRGSTILLPVPWQRTPQRSTSRFSCPLTTCSFVLLYVYTNVHLSCSFSFSLDDFYFISLLSLQRFWRFFRLENVSLIHALQLCSMAKFWCDLPVSPTHFLPHLHDMFLRLNLFHFTRRSVTHSPQPNRRT